jgi:hypothetical protein
MSYTKLFLAGLVAALVTTGCGRVAPTGANLSVDSKSGKAAGGTKLGSNYGSPVAGGGLLAAGAGTLRGKVIDAASNRGLAGAVVVLEPGGQRLTTDATGTFRASGIQSGTYTFKAMLSGMQQISTNGVVVEANQENVVPEISMAPGNGPSGITSVTYVQEKEMGRDGEPPATLVAPLSVAVRGRDVLVLDVNNSAGVKTGIVRQYDGENAKFVGKYGDYTKWLGANMMRNTVKAIALDNAGNALVLDGASKLWRFQPDGDKDKAMDIDVANGNDVAVNVTNGSIFVAHAGGITKYGVNGDGGQALGASGEVKAVAAHKDDLWAVSGNVVQKLAADGTMIQSFGPSGADAKATFTEATDIAVDPRNGNVVVVDKGAKAVYVYDAVGTLIGKVGQGTFDAPVSATVDATGRVYVVDAGKKKVYKFLPTAMR